MDNDEIAYLEEVRHLTEWCYDSNMDLNIEKNQGNYTRLQEIEVRQVPCIHGKEVESFKLLFTWQLTSSGPHTSSIRL